MLKILKEMKKGYIILVLLMIFLFIISSLLSYYTPYSGRSFIEYNLTPVSSNLSGKVTKIYVKDNEYVKKGDPIFKIDSIKYIENIKDLKAQYNKALDNIDVSNSKILQAKRQLNKNKTILKKKKLDYYRFKQLYFEKLISKSEFEKYEVDYDNAIEEVKISKEYIIGLEKERGDNSKDKNNVLLALKSKIVRANKDLTDTMIRSPINGIISMHQFSIGKMISNNSTYGYIYNKNNFNVYVDYMEKSLINMEYKQKALIIFDAIPDKLFKGHIERTTSILDSGYTNSKDLYKIDENTRWIRPSGRVRVKLILDEKVPGNANISSGSKSAVVILNKNHKILSFISVLWLKISSFINYIY